MRNKNYEPELPCYPQPYLENFFNPRVPPVVSLRKGDRVGKVRAEEFESTASISKTKGLYCIHLTLLLTFLRFYAFWTQLPVQRTHPMIHFLSLHQLPYLLQRKILADSIPTLDTKTSLWIAALTARENSLSSNTRTSDIGGRSQAPACYPRVFITWERGGLKTLEVTSLSVLVLDIPKDVSCTRLHITLSE